MVGTLRLFLAATVVLSHVGINPADIWIGVSSVCVFFMISGFAMTGMISERFPHGQSAGIFLLERFVRLAPQYYFWFLASLVVGWRGLLYGFDHVKFGLYEFVAYFMVIPLGLQTYLGQTGTLIMPQATTLGIEVAFYLASPWMLQNRLLSWLGAIVSIGIILASNWHFLPENIYTYYAAPGPMAFYVLGSFIHHKNWSSVAALSVLLVLALGSSLNVGFNLELLIGLLLGLPAILWAIRPHFKFDRILGDMSYGCFLCHFVLIALFFAATGRLPTALPEQALILIASCITGYATFWILERPTIPYRRSLRAVPQPALAGV